MSSVAYLREDQILTLIGKSSPAQHAFEGIAYAIDDYTVFHVYTSAPNNPPPGLSTLVQFVFLEKSDASGGDIDYINCIPKKKSVHPCLVIILDLNKVATVQKCFLINAKGGKTDCEIKYIPEKSELYSRSKGLLESGVLSKQTVGIVGLGSGGSPVAIELAKAGIGNFVLIDFDRLELSNISRHVCGINDLGRFKTFAIKDAILQKNPHAFVSTLEIDVNKHRDECSKALAATNLIVCASDNDQSRFFLNEIALKYKITAIFGRAITRAVGGDVLRVRPYQGPCYNCLYSQNVRNQGGDDEEISQINQAKKVLPDYTSNQDISAAIQVGLSSDIMPISNFMVKLALVELSKGLNSGIKSLEDDLIADFYIWANRRDRNYENWSKLEFNFNKPSILRWYGARVQRDPNCMVCGM